MCFVTFSPQIRTVNQFNPGADLGNGVGLRDTIRLSKSTTMVRLSLIGLSSGTRPSPRSSLYVRRRTHAKIPLVDRAGAGQ